MIENVNFMADFKKKHGVDFSRKMFKDSRYRSINNFGPYIFDDQTMRKLNSHEGHNEDTCPHHIKK